MTAFDGKVAVYGDAGAKGPGVTLIGDLAGVDGQRTRALRFALNGEAAGGVQGVDEDLVLVLAGRIEGDIAALDGVVCTVLENDGGAHRELHCRLGGGGEVDAPQGQGLGVVIPEGVRGAGSILIEQFYGRFASPDGKVRCLCCRSRCKCSERHKRQYHAQREQYC